MNQFLSKEERNLIDEYIETGYIIRKVDSNLYEKIRSVISNVIYKHLNLNRSIGFDEILNNSHKYIDISKLNDIRLKIFNEVNSIKEFRRNYYEISKPYLDTIVGNELVMQKKINLSIQLPNDDSSLLDVHADTWSGDSPYEAVVWLPLVNCFNTKSMFILPPRKALELDKNFQKYSSQGSDELFSEISNSVEWIKINSGEIMIFNQALPHGNRINQESESRWSMNCRFKSVFSPYGDKKFGEFFEPINLRATSLIGMQYKYPKV